MAWRGVARDRDRDILQMHVVVALIKDDESVDGAIIADRNMKNSAFDLGREVRHHRRRRPADPLNIFAVGIMGTGVDVRVIRGGGGAD